jgi:PAS domain S-box-containing protein
MKNEIREQINEKSSKAFLDRIAIICTVLTIIISSIILAGWLFNLFDVSSSNPLYKPTSPGSSISFVALGCALLIYFYLPFNHIVRKLAKVGVGLVLVFDLIILVDIITAHGFDVERFILPNPEIVYNAIIGRMSPISAASLVIYGFALLLLLFSPEGKKRTKSIAAYLASVSLYIGIIVVIGYLYGTPLFYGGTTIPTGLFTAIISIIFATGIITAAGKEYLPLRLFIGDSVRERLMRSFIPVMIAYILLEGILEEVFFHHSNENVLELSIIMIFFFIFGVLITSRIAQTVGGDVDRKSLIEREHAANVLRESESKFRAIFETVPDGLGLIRLKDDLLIEANNGISQMFGYSKNELTGKNALELNIWADFEDKDKMLEQLHSRDFAYGMEVKYRKKNGEISLGTYSAAKLLINNEPHLIISARDISESKRAEEMLRQSKEKYRVLIENIQDGIFIIQDAKLKFINEAFARIAGYSVQEIIGMDLRDLVAPEDRELVFDRYSRRQNGEKVPSEYEFRLVRKDGIIIIVYMNVGAFTYFGRIASIGILKDITQRKRAEKEREEAIIKAQNEKNRSEAIIAALGDGIIIQDTNYKITYQNQIQQEIYGEHAGEHCYKAYENRDTICDDCPVERTFRDGKIHRSERKVVTDKGVSYFELTSSPLRDSSGKIIAGVKMVRDISVSRRMEQTLRESEEKYRRLVETLMEGIWELDKDANTTFVNPRMAQMLGFTVNEMLGKHLFSFMDEQGRMDAMHYLERRAQNIIEQHDFEFVRKDGTRIYTSLETSPFTDENGNYSGAVAAIADITQRKRDEDEKNRLLKAIASSTDGITICNEKDQYIYVNAAYARIFGYSREDFIGETWRKITPSDMIHGTEKGLEGTLHNKDMGLFGGEVPGLRKDGELIPTEVMATALWDENGNYNGHICSVRDITERKRAEEALRESEQFLENIIESIQDGIGIIDLEMNIIKVNKTAESWYPHAVPFIGKKCYEAYHNRKERCELCPAQETFRTGNYAHKVVPKHGNGGKEVGYIEIYSYPLIDTTGQMKGVIEYVRDITQSRLEEAKRVQLVESEQKALAQVEAARKLDLMKSMFIASTSHELRTPLNSIIGFSSLVLAGMSGELNPDQKMQIGIVHSSAKHLLALVSDVIDCSKIEAGKIDVNVSQFDLQEIVDEAVITLDSSIKEKGLEMSVEVENIPMKTDRMRLYQCILNIIGNAVKYTENGSIKVSANQQENNVVISVTDTGIGIKTEDISRLFEPFVRLESPLTLKTPGTGLGLYLTQKLARDFLKGEIVVKSEHGKGSTFMLHIPVDIQKPDENNRKNYKK